MKKIIALCLFSILFSCASDTVETIKVDNKYSVEIPSFLSKGTDLHEDASLQYQNLLREFYIIVLDEPKQNFIDIAQTIDIAPGLEGYSKILKDGMGENIVNAKFIDLKEFKINGLKAKTFTVKGKIEGIDAFYKIAHLEGKDSYYQIVSWTTQKNEEKYASKMDKIIASFKEIGTGRSSDRSKK